VLGDRIRNGALLGVGFTGRPGFRAELARCWLQSAAVAGERVKLVVRQRPVHGSAESRRLRRQGLIPGVLYGRGEEPRAIAIPERDLRHALTGAGGTHAVLDVVVDGDGAKSHASVLKEFQLHPVRGTITHVDLQEVRLDQPIQAVVSVTLVGEPAGVKEGGVLSQPTTEINIEALPLEVPQHLEFDVSEMHIGDTARLSEVTIPEGVTLLDDPEEVVIATVTMPTRVEEPEPEEGEEGEGVEAEGEAAEGEEGEAAGESGEAEASGEGSSEG
jgi:large subunit ribosomal protein L25